MQVNLSSTQQVSALGALVCILQKHALLAAHSAVEGGDGPLCVIESISEVVDACRAACSLCAHGSGGIGYVCASST